ncbi:MAG: circularly permuted type 2 ATP-grasp protein, partial [Deltaproteobacteria bacterium]|nr:circularly permuted type 2 ATP-grasp protein [Deltaproteobacteria bacterium]
MTIFDGYAALPGTYDEVFGQDGQLQAPFARAFSAFSKREPAEFTRSQALAEKALLNQGVTFSVYNDARGAEKVFPFCLL